ncbi:hypothetical protein BJX66DRAFT_305394 [Aspergillus keveii]|uniref:CCHC-type domain-containing protein n=1 Tax=Aspergillus keveii TaxID=714993 RepID=A0ABR4G426_9EURO
MPRKRRVQDKKCDGCGVVGHLWRNCPAMLARINASRSTPETSRDGPENQEECAECGLVGHGPEQCPLGMMVLLHSAFTSRARRERRMRLNQSGSKKPCANQSGTNKPSAQQSAAGPRNYGTRKQPAPSNQPDARQPAPKEPATESHGSNQGIGDQSADLRAPVRRSSW